MQIPTFTTISQRPFHPLGGIINYTFHRFKPFSPTKHFPIHFHFHSLKAAITTHHEPVVVVDDNEPRFVDIGYVSGVHGFQGDVRVKPNTDFPELRFSTPGRRWLKQKVMGGENVQEIELEEGREHSGQNCWILKFSGIDSAEEAKILIGATLLVTEEDKPELEEGEFYTHDLNGMRVFMKENGKLLGTVINVFNNGANDLLQISLDSSFDVLDKNGKPKPEEIEASGQLVLVPFVEAIVPDVDMNRREMHITPPKGLLELNLRFDDRSKKERRQLEWKERKKFQKRLIAAKKKLCEMDQQHVFHGFQCGEKEQWSLLSDQIVGVNSRLLQEALQSLEQPANRWNAAELVSAMEEKLIRTVQISERSLLTGSKTKLVRNIINMKEKGVELISNGKMAIVLLLKEKENEGCIYDPEVVENEATETSTLHMLQNLLSDHEKFVKVNDRVSVPLILVSSAQQIQSLRNHTHTHLVLVRKSIEEVSFNSIDIKQNNKMCALRVLNRLSNTTSYFKTWKPYHQHHTHRTLILDSSASQFVKLHNLTGSDSGIIEVSLDRPEAKNAIGKEMLRGLSNVFELINQNSNANVALIRSLVPGVFCAGADLKERRIMDLSEAKFFVNSLRSTLTFLEAIRVPTIAVMEGVALGGGLEMALACDIRICGANALMGLPETGLAIIPGAGGTQRLPRLVGKAVAKDIIFTGRKINGIEALSMGLVNYCVAAGEAHSKALEIARDINQKGPVAVRMAKRAINEGVETDLTSALVLEEDCYDQVLNTKDRLEGLAAFAEKRKPRFTGE